MQTGVTSATQPLVQLPEQQVGLWEQTAVAQELQAGVKALPTTQTE